jgi:predicted transcriptional regulator YheO
MEVPVVDVIESQLRKRVEVLLHRLQRRRNTTLLIVKGGREAREKTGRVENL